MPVQLQVQMRICSWSILDIINIKSRNCCLYLGFGTILLGLKQLLPFSVLITGDFICFGLCLPSLPFLPTAVQRTSFFANPFTLSRCKSTHVGLGTILFVHSMSIIVMDW